MGNVDTAYVVMEYQIEDRRILRIYGTREEAQAYLDRAVLNPDERYGIQEWPVGDGGYYEGEVWYDQWITCLDDGSDHHESFAVADWPGHLESRRTWSDHFDGQTPPEAAPNYVRSDDRGWCMIRWRGPNKEAVTRAVDDAVAAFKATGSV